MRFLGICLLYFYSIVTSAQQSQWQTISIADGLSQGMVFGMIQDREGYIWMTTKNGLNRYDGHRFRVFTSHTTPKYALNTNQLTTLFEDSKQRIWIGTMAEGLNLYDRKTQRFYHCSLLTQNAQTESANSYVNLISEDIEKNIWVGTQSGTVFKLNLSKDLKKGAFPREEDFSDQVKIQLFNYSTTGIHLLKPLKNGKMLMGNGIELGLIDIHTNQYRPLLMPFSGKRGGKGFFEESDGSLIIAINNQLLRYKEEKLEVLINFAIAEDIPQIFIDSKGFVWILHQNKLYKSHYTKINQDILKHAPVLDSPKLNLLSASIYDHQGNFWLSNGGYGLFKEIRSAKKFQHTLKNKSIWSVFEDSYGRLIYSFYINYYAINRTETDNNKPAYNLYAHAIVEDGNGGFWKIGKEDTRDISQLPEEYEKMYLTRLDKNFKLLERYLLPVQNIGQNFGRLQIDRKGNLFIIGLRSTVIQFDETNRTFIPYSYTRLSPEYAGVYSTYFDVNGHLWICTQNGLFKGTPLVKGGFQFEAFRHDPQNTNTIADNQVTIVLDDFRNPEKYLWIATHGGGLNRYDKTNGMFLNFSTRNGLPNNSILGILSNEKNQLWLSTYNGLVQFNTQTFTCRNFTPQDGLQSEEFGTAACFKSKSGELMFGGVNGLNIFKSTDFRDKKKSIQVRINQLNVNNKEVVPFDETDVLSQSIEYTPSISLAHDQNQVSIEYGVIDFTNADRSRFRYQLEGINADWVEAGTNRSANFAQLPGGNYTFKVIGSIDGEVWSKPTELHIRVNPPFYLSWWAYLIYLTVFLYVSYRWYQNQLNRVRLQQQLLYKDKEAERLAELDTLKTNFFANISHEFRTPLTLLMGPLTDFQKKYPKEGLIPLMHRNLSRLQTLINQLLDLSKLEAGKMQPQIQYGDLPRFLKYVFASFESLAQTKNIIFQRSQSHTSQLAYFDEDKLEKIVTNLLSNAFKFTPENGRITVHVEYSPVWVIITVIDNGIGIDPQRLPRIFDRFYQVDDGQRRHYEGTGIGLALVKELVSTLHGTIQVQSQLDKGTSFVVKLPCDAAHWENFLAIDTPPRLEERVYEPLNEKNKIIPAQLPNQDLPILLIVEDNPDLRSYVRTIFEDTFRIEEAQDGLEGLNKAIRFIPDVVICDLMMPRLDGFGFCKALKSDLRINHIPVVMLTAKAALEDRLEGLQLGADEYLSKPFHTEELQIRVQNLLQQRRILQQKYNQLSPETQPQPPTQSPTLDEQFLQKAHKVVQSHLADSSLDVEKFAMEMDMTAVQLRRKLKALIDQTLTEYVRNIRLEKAAELLKNKAGSVSEIAYRVGFESLPYFSKVFQDKFGKAPSDWS